MKKIYKFLSVFIILFSLTSCSVQLPASTQDTSTLPYEIVSSIVICLIGVILFFIVYLASRKTDPLAKPKGIMLIAEIAVTKVDELVVENMGKRFKGFAPYIMVVFYYIFSCFFIGIAGFANPMQYYMVPFSISLITFLMIHITSAVYTKWKYFKRYTSPFAVFLPINLLSMWAPLLSMSFRLFGNAMAGYVLSSLLYSVLESLSQQLFKTIVVMPAVIAPLFHAYFDIFSGFIQTLVFAMLTMLFVSQEGPEDDGELVATPIEENK